MKLTHALSLRRTAFGFAATVLATGLLVGCGPTDDGNATHHDDDHASHVAGNHDGHNHDGHHGTIAQQVDAAVESTGEQLASATDAVKPYPLQQCLVSGENLGSMGDPYVMIHEGQQIKFCCEGCVDDFKSASTEYLSKIDKAQTDAASSHSGHNH